MPRRVYLIHPVQHPMQAQLVTGTHPADALEVALSGTDGASVIADQETMLRLLSKHRAIHEASIDPSRHARIYHVIDGDSHEHLVRAFSARYALWLVLRDRFVIKPISPEEAQAFEDSRPGSPRHSAT